MRMRRQLHRDLTAPSEARGLVSGFSEELGMRGSDARLIASELVTNSVRYSDAPGTRPIEVEVELDDEFVRIEVCDAGSGYRREAVRQRAPGDTGGFGLHVVAALADAWGVTGDGRTCAWALIDRTRAAA